MFGLFVSALNKLLGYVFRSIIVKFLVFFGLFFVVHEFVAEMVKILPSSTKLVQLLNSFPDSVWYFINYFALTEGIVLVLTAYVTRFIVRRIPLIG